MPLRPRSSDHPWWASPLATVATAALLLLTFARGGLWVPVPVTPAATSPEQLSYVTPLVAEPASLPADQRPRAPQPPATPRTSAAARSQPSPASGVLGDGRGGDSSGTPAAVSAVVHARVEATMRTGPLAGPRAAASITNRGALPARAVRDSINAALGASIPGLARTRVASQAERDESWKQVAAANREARNTGRPTPVGDPSKAGAQMGGAAVSVPIFSPGPSREERMRDSLVWKQNEPVRRRLEARLDSMKRVAARRDSVVAAGRGRGGGKEPGG